ncbi:MAG TPA: glycosyltransferase [Stellaceae bacterium]|nr:glycosyltransferase [Stellaceae bacterium]
MSPWDAIAAASFGIWLYLMFGRGGFWREGVLPAAPAPTRWPNVIAVVPARNEATFIGEALRSLLSQDYPGEFSVVLVDDHSSDGTAERAREAAEAIGAGERLRILQARSLPAGWTGKMWALSEGIDAIERSAAANSTHPELILLTDADIVHHVTNLRELAARIESGVDLASLMVKLRAETLAERFMIPAFVFFFEMLYPFSWIRDPAKRTAGAAGGCVLVRREVLRRIGGIEALRGEIIDDCALGRAAKEGGPIWLGLSGETRSLRPYPALGDIWRMVARTAYAQLGYSPLVLLATVLGLALAFVAPVAISLSGTESATLGVVAWAAMVLAFLPTLRLYERSPVWAPLLPVIAVVYMAATIDSARRHWIGKGSEWKGRIQQPSRA